MISPKELNTGEDEEVRTRNRMVEGSLDMFDSETEKEERMKTNPEYRRWVQAQDGTLDTFDTPAERAKRLETDWIYRYWENIRGNAKQK